MSRPELAEAVAAGLGIREMPRADAEGADRDVTPEVTARPALSSVRAPGDGSIRTRRVAILVADGCEARRLVALRRSADREGALPRFVSTTLGSVQPATARRIEVDVSLEAAPAVLYDAVVLPDGGRGSSALRADGRTLEFIKDQYRHCKPILDCRREPDDCSRQPASGDLAEGQPIRAHHDATRAGDDDSRGDRQASHFAERNRPPRV
jgi:catalase